MKFFVSFLALLTLGLTGCSTAGKLGGITATPLDFRMTGPATADVTLRLDNENVTAIGLDTSTHKLTLNGIFVGTAVSTTPIGLVALQSNTQTVTFKIEKPAYIRELGNNTVPFSIESLLKLTSGEMKFEIRSRANGNVKLTGVENAQ